MANNCDKNIVKLVSSVKLPTTNIYFENQSADGFAYTGFANKRCGFEYKPCIRKIIELNYSLPVKKHIHSSPVTKDNLYSYTLWACYEFANEIQNKIMLEEIRRRVNKIPIHPDGTAEYCSDYIDMIVPNGISSMAVINDNKEWVKKSIAWFGNNQVNGNWWYFKKNTGKRFQEEDSLHLAMIICHLKQLHGVDNIIISRALKRLVEMNGNNMETGKIGWAVGFLYLALKGTEYVGLCKKAYSYLASVAIRNSNFRTRGMTAYCLTK